MVEMTGGQALVHSLRAEGVRTVFGLPGIQLDWAFDALWEQRDHIAVVHPRHEQATAYMADGFARTTGEVGTCLVVPGPGLLNASAALATAYACSSPVLCIAGQVSSDQIGRRRGLLHEINDQRETIAAVCKQTELATTPQQIPQVVRRAFRALRSGRPRPVEIEVPPDVLERRADVTLAEPEPAARAEADPDLLERAARLLGAAERPLIVSGGGVLSSGAWEELRALAELLEAPVLMTDNGRGALSDRHYLAHPAAGARDLLLHADAVLAVGTRYLLGPAGAPVPVAEGQRFVQIDVDPEELGRNRAPDVAVAGDARHALGELVRRTPRHNRSRPSRRAELEAFRAERAEQLARMPLQRDLALAIREELPDDGILVNESTQVGYWARTGFPVYQPRTYLNSGYQGTLGYGFATALGVQVGNPERVVVSLNGDGGFMYNVQELSTMARFRLPVIAVVFDDGAYGNVRRIQQVRFNDHTIASDLRNPDWLRLAEAFGVAGWRATSPRELRAAMRQAVASRAPALIAVPMPPTVDLPSAAPMQPLPPRPVLPS